MRLPTDAPRVYIEGDCTALESRAETASLEGLQYERRELVKRHARLIALFGPFGLFDDCRKRLVEACKVEARMRLTAAGEKVTEDRVTSEAYGDPRYQETLDHAITDKIEYLQAQTEIDEISERIRSRELEILAYNAEMRLSK